MQVKRTLGCYSFICSDGQKWSARELKLYKHRQQRWTGTMIDTEVTPGPESSDVHARLEESRAAKSLKKIMNQSETFS